MSLVTAINSFANDYAGVNKPVDYQITQARVFRKATAIALIVTALSALVSTNATNLEFWQTFVVAYMSASSVLCWKVFQNKGCTHLDSKAEEWKASAVWVANNWPLVSALIVGIAMFIFTLPLFFFDNFYGVAFVMFAGFGSPAICYWRQRKAL